MSRAVLRKRKRLSKKQLTSVLHNNGGPAPPSDDDGDDESDVDEIENNLSNDTVIEEVEEVVERDLEELFNVMELTVMNVLNLKDVDDVSCVEKASLLINKVFHPTNSSLFFSKYWEKNALYCQHEDLTFFKKIVTRKALESTFSKQVLFEDTNVSFYNHRELSAQPRSESNIDEVKEATGQEESDDEDSEKEANEVSEQEIWKKYKAGWTVRLLTPQMYHDSIWKILSALEFEFNSRLSAELVLAPQTAPVSRKTKCSATSEDDTAAAGSKEKETFGAVSYDNVNAIILQLEGYSRWRVMPNPHSDCQLPLHSGCISLKDIDFWSKPTVDVTLSPGDSLYIPKGWVYQQDNNGSTNNSSNNNGDNHSFHLKICVNQGTTSTVADLLEVVVPQALAEAVQSRTELRSALPRSYAKHLGIAHSETEGDVHRDRLQQQLVSLLRLVNEKALDILDPAADQLVKQFIAGRLPVPLSASEEAYTAAGSPLTTIFPYTQLRMLRPGIATAVVEDGKLVVYHCMDNSRELFATPLNPLEFELDDGPAIEALLAAYPEAVTVSDLEHPSEELDDKLGVAQALYKEGFLLIADEVSRPSVSMLVEKSKGGLSGDKKKQKKGSLKTPAATVNDDDDPF